MSAVILAVLLSGDARPTYSCDYAYAAKRDAPIHEGHVNVQAVSKPDAEAAVKAMVEAWGAILEGVECKGPKGGNS